MGNKESTTATKKIYCAKNQTEKEDKKNYFRSKKKREATLLQLDGYAPKETTR